VCITLRLYTLDLIISYKNQRLLIALGGCLEEKNRPNHIEIYVGHNKKNKK